MKRLLMASVGVAALLGAVGSATAADLRRPAPAPAYVAPPLYNWTGFYLGINGGGGWGNTDLGFGFGGANMSGGLIGGTAGYNWQNGQAVFGLETDLDWSGIKSSTGCAFGCSVENTYLGTVRGRLGYAGWDRFLPYVTGGLAYGNVQLNTGAFGSFSESNVGWTVGAGIEAALVGNLTGKIEYLYVDLGNVGCQNCGGVFAANGNFTTNVVRAGVNWRF
jgi:outer membrane immunogenic protein